MVPPGQVPAYWQAQFVGREGLDEFMGYGATEIEAAEKLQQRETAWRELVEGNWK